MKDVLKCRIKPYIQPFERKLALNELRIIAGSEPKPLLSSSIEETLEFEVVSGVPADVLVDRLAYWEYIYGDQSQPTTQVLREATVNVVRNGILPEQIAQLVLFDHDIPIPNRRCLRYGTHGIHEYRGKFFPQLVRALINTANVPINGIVADPSSSIIECDVSKRLASSDHSQQ